MRRHSSDTALASSRLADEVQHRSNFLRSHIKGLGSHEAHPAYTESMQLTIHIPDETAALLQSRGVEITALIEQTVAREAQAASHRPAPEAVANAIDRILERRSRLTRNGLKIHDLIDEGRKY
jgi:post-segregation antitoxin (ccd killing protein)